MQAGSQPGIQNYESSNGPFVSHLSAGLNVQTLARLSGTGTGDLKSDISNANLNLWTFMEFILLSLNL